MTVPSGAALAIVREALWRLPVEAVVDAASVRTVLPVSGVLGPAVLSYLSPERFRPVQCGALTVEQLAADDRQLRHLEEAAGMADAGEAGVDEITSPAFAVRERGRCSPLPDTVPGRAEPPTSAC